MGDGGLQYTIAELGTAAQHDIAAKLLVVDDGGYGILREYQRDASARPPRSSCRARTWRRSPTPTASRSAPPRPTTLGEQLRWALDEPGPAVVVLRQLIAAAQPTT